VLLYFPQHDVYAGDAGEFGRIHGGRLRLCTVSDADDWFERGAPGTWRAAQALQDAGVQYDIATDRIVREQLEIRDGRIECGRDGPRYSVLIFAGCGMAEREALEAAQRLAREGATVWFVGGMPRSVPAGRDPRAGFERAAIAGAARVLPADADLASELDRAGVRRERLGGFDFLRRRDAGTAVYFLKRSSDSGFDGWLRLSAAGGTARATDPVTGLVKVVPARSQNGGMSVQLEVEPGRALIVEVGGGFGVAPTRASPHAVQGRPSAVRIISVHGPWTLMWTGADSEVHRIAADELAPWPDLPGVGLEPAAVEYEAVFDIEPAPAAEDWLLDLGDLRGSAAASLNGVPIGTAWTAPFRLRIPPGILEARNTLRLRVLVVEANRIIDLERRGVPWRKFFFVNRDYGDFHATSWTPFPVGLLGPVRLVSASREPPPAATVGNPT
jgi:hypothetical protein